MNDMFFRGGGGMSKARADETYLKKGEAEFSDDGFRVYSDADQTAGITIDASDVPTGTDVAVKASEDVNLDDVNTLGDQNEIYEIFENIGSGTTGAITKPTDSTILLDRYENAGDCLITRTDSAGRPLDDVARESDGTPITSTFDVSGNYSFSGTPDSYPVSLVYQVVISRINSGNIPVDSIVDKFELYQADEVGVEDVADYFVGVEAETVLQEIGLDLSVLGLTPTAVKTSNYTAGAQEFIQCNVVAGGFQVTIPDGQPDKTLIAIQSINVATSDNVLTVATTGSDVIAVVGGPAEIYLGLALETMMLQYNAATEVWLTVHIAPPSNFATNFPGIDAQTPISSADISINYTTRVLTVTPPLGYFYFNIDENGKATRFRKDATVDFQAFTDTSGIWYFYFDSAGDAITTQTPWNDFGVIAAVYRLLWNANETGAAKSVVENIETHENTISADDHQWKHKAGAIWFTGFDCFNNAALTGTPTAGGEDTVVSFNSGTNVDDNLSYTVISATTPTEDWEQDLGEVNPASIDNTNSALMTIKYQDAGGELWALPATRFPFPWDSGTDRAEYITATGTRTLVTNSYYFVAFVYSIQDPRTGEGLSLIVGTQEFSALADAQAYSWANIQSEFALSNDGEVRPLYKLLFQYKSTYGITNKYSALREVTDIRKQEVTQGTTIAGSIPASSVTTVPVGNLSSTNQQATNEELDTEKAIVGVNDDITEITGLVTPLTQGQGGTGGTSLVQQNLLGNSGFGVWSNSDGPHDVGDAVAEDDCSADNTEDWVASSTGSITFNTDHYELTSTASLEKVYLTAPSVKGRLYRLSVDVKDGTASGVEMEFFITAIAVQRGINFTTTGGWVTHTGLFKSDSNDINTDWGISPITDMGGANIEFKNFSAYEVTPGIFGANSLGPDEWGKDSTLDVYKTISGMQSGIRCVPSAVADWMYWGFLRRASPEFLAKFAGRTITFGCKATTAAGSNFRLRLSEDGSNYVNSEYHSGSGDEEFLEVSYTFSDNPTDIRIGWDLASLDEVVVAEPMLIFGEYIGEGNYAPMQGEEIWCEKIINPTSLLNSGVASGTTAIDLEVETEGKIGSGVEALITRIQGTNSTAGKFLLLYGGAADQDKALNIASQVAAVIVRANGTLLCDENGNFIINAQDANWTAIKLGIYGIYFR